MLISMKLQAGRCALSINGITAPLRSAEDVEIGWKVIKAVLFAKHPEYAVGKLLRTA